jgi:hypothetical protein
VPELLRKVAKFIGKNTFGNTVENKIKELDSMKECKYMGVGENQNIGQKMRN